MKGLVVALVVCSLSLARAYRPHLHTNSTEDGCPGRPTFTKVVLCYYEGRVPAAQLDPCLCSHLVLTNAARFPSGSSKAPIAPMTLDPSLVEAAASLKQRNTKLLVLGRVSGGARAALTTPRAADVAAALAQLVRDARLDGLEVALDWEGARVAGGAHGKQRLVALAKGLRLALQSSGDGRGGRHRRSYSVREEIEDDVPRPTWNSGLYIRSNGSVGVQTTSAPPVIASSVSKPVGRATGPLLLLQVSAKPGVLGKIFDLKPLARYVDLFTVPTHNLTDESETGLTFHHSRLMGLSDILNTDSVIDLLTGLGAPASRLVMTLPAAGLRFQLQDPALNKPRSPAVAPPQMVSHQEVCQLLQEGGWMVERDEDLTAPYAFRNSSWIAFDDELSVEIKGKYALLRDLAGAAVWPVDDDDLVNACGRGRSGLTRAIASTLVTLARRPRSAVLQSLVEPLVAAGNAPQLVPVSRPTRQISLSPYRVVRIVDRAGAVQVVRRDAQTEFECSRQGYYTHPQGCDRFYRCVKFDQRSDDYSVFEYDCPPGLAFDEKWEVCMWPGQARASCAGSSEIRPVPRNKFGCSAPGYYADPENCRWFFACMDHRRDGSVLTPYEFRCPFGLGFDERNLMCNWPWLVPNCANSYRESTFNALNSGVVGIGGIGIDQFLGVDPNNFNGNAYQGTSVNAQTTNFGSPPRGSNNRNPYTNSPSNSQNFNTGSSPGQYSYQGSPINSQGSPVNAFSAPVGINNNAYQNQEGNPQVSVIGGTQNPSGVNYQGSPANLPTQQTPVSFAPALQVNNLGSHPQGLPPALHVNNLGHNPQVPLTVIHPNVVNEQLHYTHPHTLVTPVPSFVVNPTPILFDAAHLGYAKQPRPLVGLTYPSRPVQPVVPQFVPQQPQTPVVQYPAPTPQYTTTPAPQVQQQNIVQQFDRPQTSVTYTQSTQAPQRDQASITGNKQTVITNTQTFVDAPVTQSFLTSGIRESQFTNGPPGIQVVTTEAPTTTTSSPALTFSNLIINQDRNYERIIEEQRRQELQRQQQERIQQQLQRERLQQQLERDRLEQQLREERLKQQREQQLLLIQQERQQQLLQQQQREREQQLLILERERQQISQQTDRDRQPVINQFTITSVTRPSSEFGARLPSSQLTTTNNRTPIRNPQNSITILSPNDQVSTIADLQSPIDDFVTTAAPQLGFSIRPTVAGRPSVSDFTLTARPVIPDEVTDAPFSSFITTPPSIRDDENVQSLLDNFNRFNTLPTRARPSQNLDSRPLVSQININPARQPSRAQDFADLISNDDRFNNLRPDTRRPTTPVTDINSLLGRDNQFTNVRNPNQRVEFQLPNDIPVLNNPRIPSRSNSFSLPNLGNVRQGNRNDDQVNIPFSNNGQFLGPNNIVTTTTERTLSQTNLPISRFQTTTPSSFETTTLQALRQQQQDNFDSVQRPQSNRNQDGAINIADLELELARARSAQRNRQRQQDNFAARSDQITNTERGSSERNYANRGSVKFSTAADSQTDATSIDSQNSASYENSQTTISFIDSETKAPIDDSQSSASYVDSRKSNSFLNSQVSNSQIDSNIRKPYENSRARASFDSDSQASSSFNVDSQTIASVQRNVDRSRFISRRPNGVNSLPLVEKMEGATGLGLGRKFDRYGPGGWRSANETLGPDACSREGLFRHPRDCNKFYECYWDTHKERYTLHVFNCPIRLSYDPSISACNWPVDGPGCSGNHLLLHV